MLETRGLTRRFGGLVAVRSLDLAIAEGEIVGIIGPNGAGKTTVFNLVAGQISPSAGRVLFRGRDITGHAPHAVARAGLTRTFQATRVFGEMSLVDNLLISRHCGTGYGLWSALTRSREFHRQERAARESAEELLGFVGLLDRREQPASSLPTEAQQRLAIALALGAGPRLLLLDEPTAGMHEVEAQGLVDLIRKIRHGGVTVGLIEHRMKLVMGVSDRVVVLNYGEKIAEGTPSQVQQDPAVIAAYLGTSGGG